MSNPVVLSALITTLGAIVVALIALWQHRRDRPDKVVVEKTEARLDHGENLYAEYRHMLDELRTDRDQWRARALAAEAKET